MKANAATRASLLTALFLAGCANAPTGQTAATPAAAVAAAKDDMVCSREYPTGSNFPITRCRSREQIEAEKAAATESLRRTQTGGPNAKMGGG